MEGSVVPLLDAEPAPSATTTSQCHRGEGLLTHAELGLPITCRAFSKSKEAICVQGSSKAGPEGCWLCRSQGHLPQLQGTAS